MRPSTRLGAPWENSGAASQRQTASIHQGNKARFQVVSFCARSALVLLERTSCAVFEALAGPRGRMKACALLLGVILAFIKRSQQASEIDHHDEPIERLGAVSFPISCLSEVQKPFELGVALLHSYWYEEAEKLFEDVATKDPNCAMAYWGQAMTLHRPAHRGVGRLLRRRQSGLREAGRSVVRGNGEGLRRQPKRSRGRSILCIVAAGFRAGG